MQQLIPTTPRSIRVPSAIGPVAGTMGRPRTLGSRRLFRPMVRVAPAVGTTISMPACFRPQAIIRVASTLRWRMPRSVSSAKRSIQARSPLLQSMPVEAPMASGAHWVPGTAARRLENSNDVRDSCTRIAATERCYKGRRLPKPPTFACASTERFAFKAPRLVVAQSAVVEFAGTWALL